MKHTKRKLLSLLLALAVICSMVPAAMAAYVGYFNLAVGQSATATAQQFDPYVTVQYTKLPYVRAEWSSSDTSVAIVSGTGTQGYIQAVGTGSATITVTPIYGSEGIPGYGSLYVEGTAQSFSVNVSSTGGTPGTPSTGVYTAITPGSLSLNPGGSGYLSLSASLGYELKNITWNCDNPYILVTGYGASATVTATANAVGTFATGTITATAEVYTGYQFLVTDIAYCSVAVVGSSVSTGDLFLSPETLVLQPNGNPGLLTASTNNTQLSSYLSNVIWSSNNPAVANVAYNTATSGAATGASVYVYGLSAGQATITATLTVNNVTYTAPCLVTVGSSISAEATVFQNENDFSLGSTNAKTTTSIADQISSSLYYYVGANRNLSYVIFNSVTSTYGSLSATVGQKYSYATYGTTLNNALTNVYFIPSQTTTGKAVFTFTAYDNLGNAYPGTLTINVEQGSASIDVLYCLTKGQSKALDASDFTSFWNNAAGSRGTLQYVTFGTASGSVGKLTYTRTGSSQSQVTSATKFYVSPSGSQYGINSVTFTPNKSGSSYATGTLAVPFTAYGTTSYYGSVTTTLSGMLYIVVTNGEVQDISYQTNGSALTLDPNDFVNVYKQAVSTTASNPTVYIQFLDVPSFGDLYYNYNASRYTSGVKLTASNIGTMRFSSRTTGTYGIDDVTYVPASTKSGDTVRYAAYSSASGGTLLYVGEISFDVKGAASIKFYGAVNGTVSFSSSSFYGSEALIYTQYINFGAPSSGTLYKDYANGKGTKVSAGSTFTLSGTGSASIPSVNSLTFVPASGFSGVVEIPFTCANVLGGQSSGTVKIYISKTFSDVPTTYWAYNYITQLSAEGVVGGTTATTFSPESQVKYGEALKMILLAAGYPKQAEGPGANWASSYLTLAYRYGIVSSTNVDLNANISRNEIAAIAAKALKLSPTTKIDTGITGPTDSTDGYVYALYNAGILNGEIVNGKNVFNGSRTLKRSELSKIVCLVSDYYTANK